MFRALKRWWRASTAIGLFFRMRIATAARRTALRAACEDLSRLDDPAVADRLRRAFLREATLAARVTAHERREETVG